MILAELEAYQSRPIAPTRRIALGRLDLPCDPAPGSGGVLLGGILARFVPELDEDTATEVHQLLSDVERGRHVAQPRARHRLQTDRIGLRPCHHRLVGRGESLHLEIDDTRGTPAQHVLAAVYATGTVAAPLRPAVVASVRKGMRWSGPIGSPLISHLVGRGRDLPVSAAADPVAWALRVLRLVTARSGHPSPSRRDVQQAFRVQLRAAHPDHGADDDVAAERIADLAEARRILLG